MKRGIFAQPITAEEFACYGALIDAPLEAGERKYFTEWLGGDSPSIFPSIHVNAVLPSRFPLSISTLERHLHTAQFFLPLDVATYLVVVAPDLPDGSPDLDHLTAFTVPGNRGIVYRKGVWHSGIAALHRPANFAVLMWRNGEVNEEFCAIETLIRLEIPAI